ncbi:unnamed protein product [Sphagnum balticum]
MLGNNVKNVTLQFKAMWRCKSRWRCNSERCVATTQSVVALQLVALWCCGSWCCNMQLALLLGNNAGWYSAMMAGGAMLLYSDGG